MQDKDIISVINSLISILEKTSKDLENANKLILFQEKIMKDAAQEIFDHWIHHCDNEGAGPVSLCYFLTGKRKFSGIIETDFKKI